MITKFITYRGITSKSLGLRIIDDVSFESPERDVELIEIAGSDGAKIHDNKRLRMANYSLPFSLYATQKSVDEVMEQLNGWLLSGRAEWSDFEKSWDSDYLYKATFYESFSIEGSLRARKKCILNFKLHPIKYLKSGMDKIVVTNGMTLKNPLARPSKPLIKLIGTGDVTLTVGTSILRLKGVSGHIIIDCATESASYENKEPQYDKVYSYPFPVLQSGLNVISWDNQAFRVEITPRWEAVVT
ncbi:hypothetical protein [Streptococcus marmotae]|uniref:hypothetical protein n=1 Tax=Streptococcus marmotae TaxID=1825069 RepID=UPI000833AD07|nr:hypothetical protein [Streptococcus marmotae]QBX16930.1 hypothetical protein Javan291_0054 [Streptococcus phage Javan291]